MDKKEFAMFTMALKTYYPRENLLPNNQAMELWFKQLNDIPYQIAEIALNKWVATNKWSPTIADIREAATNVKCGDIPDWGEAWEKVLKAIRRYGMYNIGKAMDSFDELTRECVKRLGFKEICMSENINQDRANFRMIFEQLSSRKQLREQIPANLANAIADIQHKVMIEEKGGEYEEIT